MLRRFPAVVAATMALALSACGQSSTEPAASTDEKVTIKHVQGSTELPKNPEKVVVLDYASLDSMKALGLSEKVVGVSTKTLPKFLDEFRDEENVGTLQEPDIEKIAALEPDAIIIAGRTAPKYEELSKVAPTVNLAVDGTKYIASSKQSVTNLGTIFDVEEQAASKFAEVEKAIDETKAVASKGGKNLFILTSGGKLSAYGPGSRFGYVYDVFGVKPAATNLKADSHGQAISNEFIATTNPDSMFVIDRDATIGAQGQSAAKILDNALVNKTSAAKDKKITYLDGSRWYLLGSGLDNTKEMAKELQGGLS